MEFSRNLPTQLSVFLCKNVKMLKKWKKSILFLALANVYLISLWRHQDEADARTLVITTLILSNSLLIYLNRAPGVSIFKILKNRSNKIVSWISISSVILLILALYVPSVRSVLNFSFMHPIDLIICTLTSLAAVGFSEICLSHYIKKRDKY